MAAMSLKFNHGIDLGLEAVFDRLSTRAGRTRPHGPGCARYGGAGGALRLCLELANGFGELTNAAEQRARFEHDQAEKAGLYGETYPLPETMLQALERGMPRTSGMALGFDRLVMLLTGAERIQDVLWLTME